MQHTITGKQPNQLKTVMKLNKTALNTHTVKAKEPLPPTQAEPRWAQPQTNIKHLPTY